MISVGVPMPNFSDGATPKSSSSVWLRVEALPSWNMIEIRAADVSDRGWLWSAVVRTSPFVVAAICSSVACFSDGFFSTWLMTPPVEPRPNSMDDGPISTSTESRAKVSR